MRILLRFVASFALISMVLAAVRLDGVWSFALIGVFASITMNAVEGLIDIKIRRAAVHPARLIPGRPLTEADVERIKARFRAAYNRTDTP